MGNVFESEGIPPTSNAKGDAYITEEEKLALKDIYRKISNADGDAEEIIPANLCTAFECASRPAMKDSFVRHVIENVKSYEMFETFIINCTRHSQRATLSSFWDIVVGHADIPRDQKVAHFFLLMLEMSGAEVVDEDSQIAENVVADRFSEFIDSWDAGAHLDPSKGTTFDEISSKFSCAAPYSAKLLESYLSKICFKGLHSPSFKPFVAPTLDIPSEIASPQDLLPLALYSQHLQGTWKRLYSTSVDGLSFNRVTNAVLGYDGPTCILIKTQEDGTVLGALANERWKEHNRFYGSSKNILFTLAPRLRIYRSRTPSNASYQWLNIKSHGLAHGMGFGGTTEGFRLFVPESLEECTATSSCPTYEAGRLAGSDEKFNIHTMEVWGCGGEDVVAAALAAQKVSREIENETIDKARKVDRAEFFNNEFDQEMFLSNTMSHASGGKDRTGNA